MESAFEDIIPEDDDFGFHTSPLQLTATQLKDLVQACERAEEEQALKVVRGDDLLRREDAAGRLANVASLSIPPLLPSSKWLGGASNTFTARQWGRLDMCCNLHPEKKAILEHAYAAPSGGCLPLIHEMCGR